MTGSDIKGFIAVVVTTGIFLAYLGWVLFRVDEMSEHWYGIALAIVVVLTGPTVWMLIWTWTMRLMGERL